MAIREASPLGHHSTLPAGGKRYIFFHGKRHPAEMGAAEVAAFLTSLAVQGKVAASTQNQALSALLFLYREVLGIDLPWLDEVVRAKRPLHSPVVLTREEVRAVLQRLDGVPRLMAVLLYGTGLRLLECCRLRAKDVDFATNQLTIRDGKGHNDRATMLPAAVKVDLLAHLERVRRQHEDDLRHGAGWVELPGALLRKYPNAGRAWGWQWTPHHWSSGTFTALLGVVERAAREHGDENPERTVGHASKRPGVTMTLAPQAVVVSATNGVALHTRAGPVIEGVAQARVARVAHADAHPRTALPCHGGDAAVSAESLVVSLCQGSCGPGEHRGGDDSPHSRQRPKDRHVTVRSWHVLLAEFLEQRVNPAGYGGALNVQQPQSRQQNADVGTGRLHRPRSNVHCRRLQRLTDGAHRKAPDAVDVEHRRHGLRRQAPGRQHHDDLHSRPQPRPRGGAEPGRTSVHVMDLDRPDYYAPKTDQISREVAPYIMARGLGGVLQGSGKLCVDRSRRIDSP
jgi:integrase